MPVVPLERFRRNYQYVALDWPRRQWRTRGLTRGVTLISDGIQRVWFDEVHTNESAAAGASGTGAKVGRIVFRSQGGTAHVCSEGCRAADQGDRKLDEPPDAPALDACGAPTRGPGGALAPTRHWRSGDAATSGAAGPDKLLAQRAGG